MEKAGANIDKKNADMMKAISEYVKNNPSDPKGGPAKADAEKVDKIAKQALKYVSDLKNQLITGAGGRKLGADGKPDPNGEIEDASNMEKHANLMFVQNDGKIGKELNTNINKWRVDMLAVLPADLRSNVQSDLNTVVSKGSKQTWEQELFEHSPLAAVSTILTKIENDIKNTEAQVLDELNKKLKNVSVVVDQFEAKVIPNKGTYIISGGKYEADIFLAASSSRSTFDLTVNGAKVDVQNGIGKYSVPASGQGEKKFKAVITQRQIDGTAKTYEVESEYFVTQPLAVVSATKMNVVYRAIPNPISVSVPGFDASQVVVSASTGSLTSAGQNGMYNILVPPTNSSADLTISVSVKADGGMKKMGEMRFRLKNIPKPTPQLGSIEVSGEVDAARIKGANAVFTLLKDFAFEGINYTVKGFTIVFQPKTGPAIFESVSGNGIIPSRMRGYLQNVRTGDKVLVVNIKAEGPQGMVQIPSSVVAISR
jgi:gliding motility-associated protein GldM